MSKLRFTIAIGVFLAVGAGFYFWRFSERSATPPSFEDKLALRGTSTPTTGKAERPVPKILSPHFARSSSTIPVQNDNIESNERLQQEIDDTQRVMRALGDSEEAVANRVAELQEIASLKAESSINETELQIERTDEEIADDLVDALVASGSSQEEIDSQLEQYWQGVDVSELKSADDQISQ